MSKWLPGKDLSTLVRVRHSVRPEVDALEARQLLTAATFAHPGILNTQTDYSRMATRVAAKTQPWYAGWQALQSASYAQLGATPRPLVTVVRANTGSNFAQMFIDIQRSYDTALEWKVSGNTAYADQTVRFLNAWASTNTSVTGDTNAALARGLYGFQWANIAEMMRSYSGWAAADQMQFANYLTTVYLPGNQSFLSGHNGAAITNYWANWDLCNLASEMAIGIFTDDHTVYQGALDYIYGGAGNGAFDKAMYYLHPGNLGQGQEEGRDQGHSNLDVALMGEICQMAWNQGDDLFSYNNNELLAMTEYLAKYNLGNDVPYVSYAWGSGVTGSAQQQSVVGNGSRGQLRPIFELVYNHYVNVEGLAAPYTAKALAVTRPEGDNGNGDEYSWGTLIFAVDPITTPQAPQDLVAYEKGTGSIQLNWWGGANDVSYSVYRATGTDGVYTRIAAGITDATTYTDTNLPAGTYFYKVTGVSGSIETTTSNVVTATSTSLLVAHLTFDQSAGTSVTDSTGNGVNGAVNGGATFVPGKSGNAVSLNGTGGYVSLPAGALAGVSDFTIAATVYLNASQTWARIFDFGDGRGDWMFLTPRDASGVLEFATGTTGNYNKQSVLGKSALSINQWVSVAITFSDRLATLYVNGIAVGSNASMDFPPYEINGGMPNSWIGRSQYAADPYLNGKIDDFQIYRGALTAGQVYTLATGTTASAVPAAPESLTALAVAGGTIKLNWSAVAGATSYAILKSGTSGGPYVAIATLINGTTYADSGLTSGSTYFYVVESANNGGPSSNSPQASATALPPSPSVPTGLTAVAMSATSVQLSWTPGANDSTYSVLRSITMGGPYTVVAAGLTDTSYADVSLSAGTSYFYVVTGGNAAGVSATSMEASATTASAAPIITGPASASSTTVTGNSVNLSVAAANPDSSTTGLSYTWTLAGTQAGLAVFLANSTAAARNTTAVFTRAGTYTFVVTVTCPSGLTATSSVVVSVVQTLTRITVTPVSTTASTAAVLTLAALAVDQFGIAMATQPTVAWSIASGGGSISSTGVYTAPSTAMSAVVRATAGSVTGTATITVVSPVSATVKAVPVASLVRRSAVVTRASF